VSMVWHHGLYHFSGIGLPVHDLASCMGVAWLEERLLEMVALAVRFETYLKNTKMSKEMAYTL
jgi:hypothetical protein